MEEMIREAFVPGSQVEILLRNYKVPTVGKFVGCNDGCIMLRTSTDKTIIICVSDIVRISDRSQYEGAATVGDDSFIEPQEDTTTDNFPAVRHDAASNASEENAGALTASADEQPESSGDRIESNLFKLPTEKPEVKVIGRIDLSSIRDPRKRHTSQYEPAYRQQRTPSRYQQQSITFPTYFYDEGIKSNGKIMRKGPAFGFIQTPEGKQVYMNCNEIVTRKGHHIPSQDDEVVFTVSSNRQGMVAKCVHSPMSVGEQLEFIEEIMQRDRRNARYLASQLQQEYPNDENIIAALQSLGMASYSQMPQMRPRFDARQVLDLVQKGEHVDGRSILRAEKELSETAVYDDYKHYANTLLSYAISEEPSVCYQLFSRMVKMARANENEDDAQEVIDQAIDLYKDTNTNVCQYFQNLREVRQPSLSETEEEENETEAPAPAEDSADSETES